MPVDAGRAAEARAMRDDSPPSGSSGAGGVIRRRGLGVLKTTAEVVVAIAFLVVAAETFAHRHFSPEPRWRAPMWLAALFTASLGLLPLLVSQWRGAAKIVGFVCLAAAVGLFAMAVLHALR